MRLDLYLFEKGFAPSRSKAQELIKEGAVEVKIKDQWSGVFQPSFEVVESAEVKIIKKELLKYVSRGGIKLEGALARTNLKVSGLKVLDIGQSTGGFTDCALQMGAELVLGFDVGTGQLHEKIKSHPKVLSFEHVHVAQMHTHPEIQQFTKAGFDLCVVDVSFISLRVVLRELSFIECPFKLIALVKPQFEVGKEGLGKGGIVKDDKLIGGVLVDLKIFASGLGFQVHDMFPASIAGGDGNQEHFLYAERK